MLQAYKVVNLLFTLGMNDYLVDHKLFDDNQLQSTTYCPWKRVAYVGLRFGQQGPLHRDVM